MKEEQCKQLQFTNKDKNWSISHISILLAETWPFFFFFLSVDDWWHWWICRRMPYNVHFDASSWLQQPLAITYPHKIGLMWSRWIMFQDIRVHCLVIDINHVLDKDLAFSLGSWLRLASVVSWVPVLDLWIHFYLLDRLYVMDIHNFEESLRSDK